MLKILRSLVDILRGTFCGCSGKGLDPTPKFWTNARLVGLYRIPKSNNASTGNITNGEGTEYTTLNIGVAYEVIKNWSITADYQTYNTFLVSLKNVYSAPFYQIGISAEF